MLLSRRVIAALGIIVFVSVFAPPVQATLPITQQSQYSRAGYRSRVYTSDLGRLQGLP